MQKLDKNRLHEIASGFVTIEHDPDWQWPWSIKVGEVEVQALATQEQADELHGLLVVEVMKMLTGVMERNTDAY